MTRIIAGTAGGRRLQVPAGGRVRPTSDRVKEALFSSLGDLTGAHVLDLFAGTGGLGIEALSRGAAAAVLVEADRRTAGLIRRNLATAGVGGRAEVIVGTARAFAEAPVGGPFDVVLADPPYDTPLADIEQVVGALVEAEQLRPDAVVVLERDRHRREAPLRMLTHDRDRSYGETLLRYHVHDPQAGASALPSPPEEVRP